MSADFVDFRCKLDPDTHAVLSAVARARQRDLQFIVRELLDQWAADQVRAATLIRRLARHEGTAAASRGTSDTD